MTVKIVISGSGLTHPTDTVTNEELVESFNQYVRNFNEEHRQEIEAGSIEALKESSSDFILKASGIESRYARDKKNMLDPKVMWQYFEEGPDEELSLQAAEGLKAAQQALRQANKSGADIDIVIISASHKQRDYPAISIEIQKALGAKGFAFDMGAACSSATFGIQMAADIIRAGHGTCALIITPEISLGKVNFRDRDSHFIFGEATTAVVLERADKCNTQEAFEIIDSELFTEFSNNIRNNSGAYDKSSPTTINSYKKMFYQEGRKVFKELTPKVVAAITTHLQKHHLNPNDIHRYFLHQANLNMNLYVAGKLVGEENVSKKQFPIVLNEFANSAGAGCIIAFHRHHEGIQSGEYCILSSFGAGYSIGVMLLRKV
jgi:beta-ketodecanoyl-[acyl-carrier-protein] synthase